MDAGAAYLLGGNNHNAGILVTSGAPSIVYATFSASSGNDVEVAYGALPRLRFNVYGAVPAGHFGVVNDGWSSGQPLVDASYSWWGDPSGPTTSDNPGGTGTPVSAGVSYRPWVGTVPGPTLTLSATSGGAGTQVNVIGSGFQSRPAREVVNLYLGSQAAGTTQVLFDLMIINVPLGRISTTIIVPTLAPGTYTVWAIGQTSGRFAFATFTVTARGVHQPDAQASEQASGGESGRGRVRNAYGRAAWQDRRTRLYQPRFGL